jgi:hypothetical protein
VHAAGRQPAPAGCRLQLFPHRLTVSLTPSLLLQAKMERADALAEERTALTNYMRNTLITNELKFKEVRILRVAATGGLLQPCQARQSALYTLPIWVLPVCVGRVVTQSDLTSSHPHPLHATDRICLMSCRLLCS